ncbi:folliculin-like isoform X2 [Corticium candelabrum]|uniref:folliculin-like isoform X2 n=1 Tax=Corticium candelabrum TaxID=121492 RepID=UPI002E2725C1|nr:folliculin-like isoform X2 [Corticium candelabrum]
MNAVVALCHFCELHGPSVVFCTQAFYRRSVVQTGGEVEFDYLGRGLASPHSSQDVSGSSLPGSAKITDLCEACRSLGPDQAGYISHDREAQIRYVSGQYPAMPQLYSIVRQACVRSLSCEVCQGRSGPMIFGDNREGHVFSYTFFLRDRQARGLQRWYSIIIVTMDKVFLINSWSFLVKNCQTVIEDLQDKAQKKYDSEGPESTAVSPTVSSLIGPSIDQFRRRRGLRHTFRSIAELTGEMDLYRRFHIYFSLLLKAGGSRLIEQHFEGSPWGFEARDDEPEDSREVSREESLGLSLESEIGHHDLTFEKSDDSLLSFNSLKHFYKVVGRKNFQLLAKNVLVGNQLIVRGSIKPLVVSALQTLQSLLPAGCCQVIPYSSEYLDSYKCNFLGIHSEVQLPSHLRSAEMFVLLDITRKQPAGLGRQQELAVFDSTSIGDYNFAVHVSSSIQQDEKLPSMLTTLENALAEDAFSDSVVEQCLVSIKAEWMNKVKVLFKFRRTGQRTQEDLSRLLNVLHVKPEDRQLTQFWTRGLGHQYRTQFLAYSTSPTSSVEKTVTGSQNDKPPSNSSMV